jgi:predicted RNA binding protein YcfA (HicA-like mRNA interferase family)
MGRLRVVSAREVVAFFVDRGFVVVGQRGSHFKLRRVGPTGEKQTLVVPNHSELEKGTTRALIRQGGQYLDPAVLKSFFYED